MKGVAGTFTRYPRHARCHNGMCCTYQPIACLGLVMLRPPNTSVARGPPPVPTSSSRCRRWPPNAGDALTLAWGQKSLSVKVAQTTVCVGNSPNLVVSSEMPKKTTKPRPRIGLTQFWGCFKKRKKGRPFTHPRMVFTTGVYRASLKIGTLGHLETVAGLPKSVVTYELRQRPVVVRPIFKLAR